MSNEKVRVVNSLSEYEVVISWMPGDYLWLGEERKGGRTIGYIHHLSTLRKLRDGLNDVIERREKERGRG